MAKAERTGRSLVNLTALAVVAALALCAQPASASSATLAVHVVGLRNDHGQLGCLLFDADRGFPANASGAFGRRWCPIRGTESSCVFDGVPGGTYAVACFHDENRNGKLDTGFLGIPTEGTVASNQAKGFMGPPKFADARFRFSGQPSTLTLRMGY